MTNEKNAPERVWITESAAAYPIRTKPHWLVRDAPPPTGKWHGPYIPATALEALREENARLREVVRSLQAQSIGALDLKHMRWEHYEGHFKHMIHVAEAALAAPNGEREGT